MKLEIKKINLSSFLFGAFPMVILCTSFVLGFIGIFFLDNPAWIPVTPMGKLVGLFLHSLVFFLITAAYLVFLAFVYNFFVEIVGMKGISVKIEEIQ
ncbi:MAG: hypothetical protein GX447_06835 [Elusimicrobia bacterium]|nr:hypothetical protein [Elusimicrobiota bacterium]